MLSATQRVEQGPIENDVVPIHRCHFCIKLPCVGSVNVLEVQLDCHGLGRVGVLMRLTVKPNSVQTAGLMSWRPCFFNSRKLIMRPLTSSQSLS